MLRKLHAIIIAMVFISAMTCFTFALDGDAFRVYNPSAVTSDLDATYIQGNVDQAKGQKITVTSTEGVSVEKTLPNTGEKYEFRIKIPRSTIKEDKVNSYAVSAETAEGKMIRTTYVRITYKAKKDQTIKAEKEEYTVDLPGDPVAIAADSSAGLDLDYSSSDESVVKVDDEGNLEAVKGGTAEIVISQSNDNEYEDAEQTVKVSVKEYPHYTVRFHLGKNASALFTATDTDSDEDTDEAESVSDDEDAVIEQKIAVGKKTKLLSTADKKNDFEFVGWSATRTGYPEYENTEEVLDLAEAGETVDLYAVWHGERAMGAIEWAKMIAADDSWTYGQGTFKCHVCGTAPKKQYTCMPFLGAAYAHGAEDPIMLSGGRHVINLHDGNFKGELGQIWEKIGLCKDVPFEDLRAGDVIIAYSADNAHGHAWMYCGDDSFVEAVPSDIQFKESGAESKYKTYANGTYHYGSAAKNFVMRYKY